MTHWNSEGRVGTLKLRNFILYIIYYCSFFAGDSKHNAIISPISANLYFMYIRHFEANKL